MPDLRSLWPGIGRLAVAMVGRRHSCTRRSGNDAPVGTRFYTTGAAVRDLSAEGFEAPVHSRRRLVPSAALRGPRADQGQLSSIGVPMAARASCAFGGPRKIMATATATAAPANGPTRYTHHVERSPLARSGPKARAGFMAAPS